MESDTKLMSAKEAVAAFIHDGEELITGNYTQSLPMALIFEVIRQGKKRLTYFSQSGSLDADFLVAGGCLEKMVCAYMTKWGGREGGTLVERHQRSGRLSVEDYGNFTYAARLAAGAYGYSFMPVMEAIMDTDVFRIREFMGDKKFGVVKCPFTDRKIPVVPAANPDTCIVHVQRADKYGNAQHWGGLGSTVHACLASKKIIVSCEQVVDHSIIKASPHLTIVPAFRANAVVEQPWGGHPHDLAGCYGYDRMVRGNLFRLTRVENGFQDWMKEWVLDLPDHNAYIEHYIQKFGYRTLENLRTKATLPAQPDFGARAGSVWTQDGISRELGVNYEEFLRLIAEKGEVIDVP